VKPHFAFPHKFHAELTGHRSTERSFFVRRHQYHCWYEPDWCFTDRDGQAWRPARKEWHSDGASIPHPLDWLVPAFDGLRYRQSTMGIHDPACRDGKLERWDAHKMRWVVVAVPRSLADSLLQQAIHAEGGWALTRGAYWLGVRIGSGFRE
jgi:hypothetical protein